MGIGAEIKRRRKALRYTLEDMAARVGSDTGNLSRIERSQQGISEEMLFKFAKVLGCTVANLYEGVEGVVDIPQVPAGARRVPLIDYVEAGCMTEVVDPYPVGAADEWLLTSIDLSPKAFALEIKGNSMQPEFRPGDLIIIEPELSPQPGDYVVARNGKNEATFKKYRYRGSDEGGQPVFELVPLNEDFETLRSDNVPLQIIGTMVEHRRYRSKI